MAGNFKNGKELEACTVLILNLFFALKGHAIII